MMEMHGKAILVLQSSRAVLAELQMYASVAVSMLRLGE
jgi:hypothetical protein